MLLCNNVFNTKIAKISCITFLLCKININLKDLKYKTGFQHVSF